MSVDVVKIQARSLRPSGTQYLLTIPSELIRDLGWTKGDKLIVRVMDLEIDGVKRKALVYYKP
jgi:hypothetical protein